MQYNLVGWVRTTQRIRGEAVGPSKSRIEPGYLSRRVVSEWSV